MRVDTNTTVVNRHEFLFFVFFLFIEKTIFNREFHYPCIQMLNHVNLNNKICMIANFRYLSTYTVTVNHLMHTVQGIVITILPLDCPASKCL